MKKSLIWGRCGLVVMAAMAFVASAAPPPTTTSTAAKTPVNEYYSKTKTVDDKTAVGQVASAAVQPGNDIKVASCSPPTSVVDSKVTTVKNCGWGKVVVGIQRGAPPVIGFDTARAAGNISPTYSMKTTFAAGQGLRVGSACLTGLASRLDYTPLGTVTISAAASLAITPAKDLDPVFGGTIATDSGAITA